MEKLREEEGKQDALLGAMTLQLGTLHQAALDIRDGVQTTTAMVRGS
jgi:hypothetical protein